MSYCLFPGRTLDRLERFLVALATSVAISSLVGTILIYVTGNLQPSSFVPLLATLTAAFAVSGYARSRHASGRQSGAKTASFGLSRLGARVGPQHLVALLAAVACLAVAGKAAAVSTNQDPSLPLTEFYISPQYLDEMVDAEPDSGGLLQVPVEIANRQGGPMTYRILVLADGRVPIWEGEQIAVEADHTLRQHLRVPLPDSQGTAYLDLHLIAEPGDTVLAQLRLWLPKDDATERQQALPGKSTLTEATFVGKATR
jgi:uncharacterized membrane protein